MVSSATLSLLALSTALLSSTTTHALSADDWRSKTIYQVVTDRFARPGNGNVTGTCNPSERKYCGGTYSGIIDRLDYIQGMGFDAVWISPIVQNIGATPNSGEAYHGYWSLDISKTNDHFGTGDNLRDLSTALHSRGMYLMLDVVVNHVAATTSSTFKTSSAYGPFDVDTDIHPFCWIDQAYTNQTNVEQCWLGDQNLALVDLNTEDPTVVDYFNNWIKQVVKDYSVDGVRIDTVKHVRKDFWPAFANAAGVFTLGEVLEGTTSYVAEYQQVLDSVLNYPAFYQNVYAFQSPSGNMAALAEVHNNVSKGFKDPTLLGNFLDNHDQPRFASTTGDVRLIQNALTFPFVTSGIPILYYGQEQGFTGGADPLNREPMWNSGYDNTTVGYEYVKQLLQVRDAAGAASSDFYKTKSTIALTTDHEIVISKPPLLSILTNRGSNGQSGTVSVPANASLPQAAEVVDLLTCTSWRTDRNGASNVTVSSGSPQLILPKSQIGNLCPNGVTASTTTPGSTDTEPAGTPAASPSSGGGGQSAGFRTMSSGLAGGLGVVVMGLVGGLTLAL